MDFIVNRIRKVKELKTQLESKEKELARLQEELALKQKHSDDLNQTITVLKDEKYALLVEREKIDESSKFATPGHYYSPIPSIPEIKIAEEKIWGDFPRTLPAIDLNTEKQLKMVESLSAFYNEIPFGEEKKEGLRYYANNIFYPWTDGAILYSFLRHLQPNRVIEVGSGFSSAIMMDTNDLFFNNSINLEFVEPYPDRLNSLMTESDSTKCKIHQQFIQDIPVDLFAELGANDILFIDSSHVSKVHSDVNKIFFEILPALKKGVYIHFHDLFYPFEYHKEWIYKGVVWNEAYLLRAFMQYNDSFEIVFWNTYLYNFHKESFRNMPKCMEGPGGNIWLKKIK
ncbi:MAG: hypothetical protein JWP69_1123 [Flaviaesturariibacter sp.]|nr:hypothetical protein [Flaviaesturariibacter sp.]